MISGTTAWSGCECQARDDEEEEEEEGLEGKGTGASRTPSITGEGALCLPQRLASP